VKISARAADLNAAIAFTRRGVERKATDILRVVLLRTTGDSVEIIGHTLDRCHAARCPAAVHVPGVGAVPAHRLAELIDATPAHAMVTITSADGTVTVAAGCSRYRLPALPVDDFPTLVAPGSDAVSFDLTDADVAALLSGPAKLVRKDDDRPHLRGVFLHVIDRRLAVAVTDGLILLRRTSAIAVPALPGGGIIVPPAAAEEIDRAARRTGVTLVTDGRKLEARVDNGRLTIVSKLIDGTFPDCVRLVPPLAAATVEFAAADVPAALARLAAASSYERPTAGLIWDGGDTLSLCLAHEDGIAADAIAATTTGNGRVACSVVLLTKVIKAMDTARLRLSVDATPGAALRFDPPEDDGTVAVIAPIRWSAAASAAVA
jgi:DNA polymerase III subunit beta